MGAGIEVVDGMHAGQSQHWLVACWEMPYYFRVRSDTLITLPFMCAALGRVEPELVGLPGMAFARDDMRRLRFDVHAAGWLLSMVLLLMLLSIAMSATFRFTRKKYTHSRRVSW